MEGLAAYSHLLSRVERSLVLDIGCRYTKCGFAGKHSPSVIIPTRFVTSSGKEVCFFFPIFTKPPFNERLFCSFLFNLPIKELK